MEISKTRSSFYRRLYLAWLIDSGTATTLNELMAVTGMPRRTAQDTLAALAELDIDCQFQQEEGQRHNNGCYQIINWGPINPAWLAEHHAQLRTLLGY